jgi:hypothetical protein
MIDVQTSTYVNVHHLRSQDPFSFLLCTVLSLEWYSLELLYLLLVLYVGKSGKVYVDRSLSRSPGLS